MACYYFKMIPATGSPLYLEDEPIGWDAIQIILKRDRDWHGVNYEFTEGDIQLGFDCLAGRDFIEEIYQAQGGDGYIGFQFGYYDGTEHVDFDGKINLYTRKWVNYRIVAAIERNNDHDKIKARWTTKASMTALESLDGDAIVPPTPYELTLHSKTLQQTYNKEGSMEGTFAKQPFLGESLNDMWFVFNTAPQDINESNIQEAFGSDIGPSGSNPVTNGLALVFQLKAAGHFVFDFSDIWFAFSVKLMNKAISATPKIGAWTINIWLDIYDSNNNLKAHKLIGTKSGTKPNQELNSEPVQGSLQYTTDLAYGDKIYWYAHFNFDGYNAGWKGIEAAIFTYHTKVSIVAQTFTEPSTADVFLIYESIDQGIAVITGVQNQLYSDFFGRTDIGYAADGCGSLKSVLNGFGVRKFNNADHPLQLSLQEQLQSLDAIFCIGMGYEAGLIRVEDREYFYNDQEIMELDIIGDYSEEVAKDLTFNSINIGYQKYLEEGEQLLDQFSTEHEYATPIKSNDNKYSKLAAFIASGEALEVTRRYLYADTPKDSTKYDDDTFLVAMIRNGLEYATEKDAAFDVVTGIIDPATAYNLRHTPHRNLLNHAKWLNGGLYYKSGGELVKNTFVKQNGELTTQLDSADPCPLGDVDFALLQEKANIYLTMFAEKSYLFIPEWVTCTTRLSMDSIRDIKDCMTGQDNTGRNYGYISFRNPSLDTVQGWLYDMRYSPVTEKVTFLFLKKKVIPLIPVTPLVCSDYADFTFAMFEALPNLSPEIEQCRFLNFN